MNKRQISVASSRLKLLATWVVLLTSNSLMAQPPAPGFEGHHDFRSREPGASALRYDWACGKIKRSIEFRLSFRQMPDKDGAPHVVAAWSIGRYIRDGEMAGDAGEELSAFVSSLGALNYIAGRCFDTEGEVRISGTVMGSNVPVTRTFRIP